MKNLVKEREEIQKEKEKEKKRKKSKKDEEDSGSEQDQPISKKAKVYIRNLILITYSIILYYKINYLLHR